MLVKVILSIIDVLPSSLLLLPTGGDNYESVNFTVTWTFSSQHNNIPLTISIFPSPLYQDTVNITSKSSVLLNLNTDTSYTVNISACPDMAHTAQFTLVSNLELFIFYECIFKFFILGRFPLFTNSLIQSVLYYNISISGIHTVMIQCLTGTQVYSRECGRNGQWNANLTSSCLNSERTTCKHLFTEVLHHTFI